MGTEITTSTRFYDFLAWLDANKRRLIVAVVILAVAGLVTAFMIWRGNQRELEANEALSNVQPGRTSSRQIEVVPSEAYLKVAMEFNGTSAGARALLLGAVSLFVEGKAAEAQAQFTKFQPEYPDNPLLPEAIMGIAACLEAQGKSAEAITKYQEVISRFPRDHTVGQAKLALALIYENQNKPEQAQKLYAELTQGTAYSSSGAEAGMRLEELLLKHPGLAPTNAPPSRIFKPE
ncbi:MAG: tetratricopeptide repeat protein [Verrucomicrobia bacterium]|nr:tetratricopeptide repeat protein [Verrucomicrobiota bacterium]